MARAGNRRWASHSVTGQVLPRVEGVAAVLWWIIGIWLTPSVLALCVFLFLLLKEIRHAKPPNGESATPNLARDVNDASGCTPRETPLRIVLDSPCATKRLR